MVRGSRRLRIGYTRAARLVDSLEEKGVVGPPEGHTQLPEPDSLRMMP